MLANPYALRERSVTGVTKRLPYEGGGEDPNDRKGKLPKKTCGNGSPTTTYGAPTGDKEFNVGIIGTNWGAKTQVPIFRAAGLEVVALCSRRLEKARDELIEAREEAGGLRGEADAARKAAEERYSEAQRDFMHAQKQVKKLQAAVEASRTSRLASVVVVVSSVTCCDSRCPGRHRNAQLECTV